MSAPVDPRRIATIAASGALHRAFRWIHLHELQIRQWQMEFLAIPAPTFEEDARAVWFCRLFRQLGLREAHLDAVGNVVALAGEPASPQSPAVVLSAHMDTVFPRDTPVSPREDGSRILCPGACDNGAGLAGLLALAAAVGEAEIALPCPVIFTANVGEEGAGDLRGIRHLFAQPPFTLRPAALLALEGAGTALAVNAGLGSRRLEVTVTGPGGHSWVDAQRPNAILALGAALQAVSRLPVPTQPRTTLNVGTFQGGTSVNSIPERASAQLDLRSVSEHELDRLEITVLATLTAEIAAESRRFDAATPLELHVRRIGNRPVGALPPDASLAQGLRAVDRHLGIATDLRIGSTDANLPLSLGIPALAIGAGGTGGGLHSTAEWYDPTGRELALRRILLLLLDTCHTVRREQALPVG